MSAYNVVRSARAVLAIAATMAALATPAAAQTAVKFSLDFKFEGPAAPFVIGLDKGYYKAEGLDVTIKPGGPDVSPVQVLAGNQADAVVNWMPDALAAREAGVALVNIAQIFDRSGLMLPC